MSYAKSLKKSPFQTLSITLGKMPDGSIWQTAFITQDGDMPSASFDCLPNATAAERKGFFPLVKEALKRAQSLDELTDMLKPFAVDRPVPVEKPGHKTLKDHEQWTAEQQREVLAHESTLRGKLIFLLQVGKNETASIEAVLNSGLLPDDLLQQWLNQLVERAIRRVLGRSGCPAWENWAAKWLSGEDRTEDAARKAADAAGYDCCDPARAISRVLFWNSKADAVTDLESDRGERKAQYDDLFNLINAL